MGNLGWYQLSTTFAKKVGGPVVQKIIHIGIGTFIGGGSVIAGNAINKKIKKDRAKKKSNANAQIIYSIHKKGRSNEGLLFKAGDTFRVLERDGDAVLIEKTHDNNNPYFVSARFISSISNYISDK